MKKILFALTALICFSQCSTKTYSLQEPTETFIEIGSYGGFSGLSEVYHFLANGQRYFVSSMTGEAALESVNKKEFKSMCKELLSLGVEDMLLNEPGNMNYYIRLKMKGMDKKVLWNNPETAPKELVDFASKYTKDLKPYTVH